MLKIALICLALAQGAAAAPAWKLSWSDEFEGKADSAPDSKKWSHEIGGGGWGNNELQCYTKSSKNVRLDGKGSLIIEARKDMISDASGKGCGYSSGRLVTKGKFSQAYGRIEARMKIPGGKGVWPAFWMLGEDIPATPWPQCGEIDIMEHVGHESGTIHGTVHGPGYSGAGGIGQGAKVKEGENLADQFHVVAVEWEPAELRWYLDGRLYFKLGPQNLKGKNWVYDHPHFLLLNLAVGGNWPGNPEPGTRFPALYVIDYVRVYQDPALKMDGGSLKKYKEANDAIAMQSRAPAFKAPARISLPGRIEAENFSAYQDREAANFGGEYRVTEGVDIQACTDEDGQFNLGWTRAGEWLEYDLATAGGQFSIKSRVACEGAGGKMEFSWLGQKLKASLQVPDSGGWQKWVTVSSEPVQFQKGAGKFRVLFQSEGPANQSAGNINFFEIVKGP